MIPIRKKSAQVLLLPLAAIFLVTPGAIAQSGTTSSAHAADSKPWPQQAVRGAHGMVATDEALGSQVGVDIMKRGGNAVDAAVAVARKLAVRLYWM